MATVESVLALYAALDRAVVASGNDPGIAADVEKYLPGSTGENAGWSREIENFLGVVGDTTFTFPELTAALADLPSRPVNAPVTGRVVFAVGALLNVEGALPRDTESIFLVDKALTLALPEGSEGMEKAAGLRGLLEEFFTDRGSWETFAMMAYGEGLLSENVARWRPCDSRLVIADDLLAVDITTYYEDPKLDIAKVRAILDPVNWPDLSPSFCKVFDMGNRLDGWTSALELVSLTCPDLCLSTALKFFKSDLLKGQADDNVVDEAHVDYDLDDTPPIPGDGFVKVDRGYLNVSALETGGVGLFTKKVVHISLLSPLAQQMFACLSGYGSIAADMILGGAQYPPKNAKPWQASQRPAGSASVGATQTDPSTPTKPKPVLEPMSAAVELVNECAKDLTTKASEVAEKWTAGTLTTSDMVAYSTFISARVASDPWRLLELFTKPLTVKTRGDTP